MTPNTRTRRQMLKLTGSLAVVGLAGCSTSGDGPDSGGGTDAPPATEDGHDDGDDHADEDDHQETDEHGHNHDEGTPEAPMHAAEVAMRTEGDEQHFAPHMTWVEVGGTVTWHVESGTHDVVAYHPDNDRPQRIPDAAMSWASELLGEGESFEHTFEEPGVYDYFCTPHESVGMVGTVIVGEPDAHDQPALEDPQASLPDGARGELADLGTMVNEALGHTH